jgi:hypothetical protein
MWSRKAVNSLGVLRCRCRVDGFVFGRLSRKHSPLPKGDEGFRGLSWMNLGRSAGQPPSANSVTDMPGCIVTMFRGFQ